MLPLPRRLRGAVPALVAALSLGVAPSALAAPADAEPSATLSAATGSSTAAVLVTGPAAAVRQAKSLLASGSGFTDLPVIGGFSARVSTAQRAALVAHGLTVTDDAPVHVADADWGENSHQASAVYPRVDGAPSAWADHLDGSGVAVAVVDTGISDTGDLAGKVVDGIDLSGEHDYTEDSFGHGTFVGGIIAGSGAASRGAIKGVAPGANLVSLKVAGADGSTDIVRVIVAIQWAVNHARADHIRVLNLSLGTDSTQDWRIDPLDAAVEGAWHAGLVVTVAAGNNGSGGISKPGDDPYVITVGATDDATTVATGDDTVAPYSSTGPTAAGVAKPDLVAPGSHLVSTRASGSTVDTAHPDARVAPSYFRGSGTSFSAPQAAAAAALLLQQRPQLDNDQIKGMLARTAAPLAHVPATAQGAGELDIHALLGAKTGQPANAGLWGSNGSGSPFASEGSLWHAGWPSGGDSAAWHSEAWNSEAWGSEAWGHAAWNSEAWGSEAWGSEAWGSEAWGHAAWGSEAWGSEAWGSEAWGSEAWGSEAWGVDAWTSMGFWSAAWK